MPLFLSTWKLWPDKKSDAYTIFASMDEAAHKEQMGEGLKQLGRWHNPAKGIGFGILEAVDAKALHNFLWKWAEDMMDVESFVVADDNQCREIVLGKSPPSWVQSYDSINDGPRDGESLYMGRWEHETCKANIEGTAYFANMTEEENKADIGSVVRFIGRWHMMTEGKGYVICAAKDPMDVVRWAYKWAGSGKIVIEPVVNDTQAAEIVKGKDGYETKLTSMMEKLGK